MPHLLRHGTSISERPVILTSECRAHGEGAITTYFKRFKVWRGRSELELMTSRLLERALHLGYRNRSYKKVECLNHYGKLPI
jgi:hypothetical protein